MPTTRKLFTLPLAMTACAMSLALPASAQDDGAPMSGTMSRADDDMARVLEALQSLEPEPIPELSAEEARQQPTPADAVAKVIEEEGLDVPEPAVTKQDITYPAAAGDQPARVYTPTEAGDGPFPLVVYVHGGGWVIADIDTYDASAAALADKLDAVVISLEYRHAPEDPFPAAHEDVLAGYKWAVENGGQYNADADRLALVGERGGRGVVGVDVGDDPAGAVDVDDEREGPVAGLGGRVDAGRLIARGRGIGDVLFRHGGLGHIEPVLLDHFRHRVGRRRLLARRLGGQFGDRLGLERLERLEHARHVVVGARHGPRHFRAVVLGEDRRGKGYRGSRRGQGHREQGSVHRHRSLL